MTVAPTGSIDIAARDDVASRRALATVDQLRRQHRDGRIPTGRIEDRPDTAVRGVMLDVSRCRVPTLDTLRDLVDRLASWKYNHLQLYMEHTFAYAGHDEVWTGADPYAAADLEELAEHCRLRGIELVPNQNTLGHMERWLVHERYAPLGIARGVVTNPLGLPMVASTLDPRRPGSFPLVRDLVDQLAAVVPAGRFHVGLDEPWDLPADRAEEWVSWAGELRNLDSLSDREMLVWGDILSAHPELLTRVPGGVTVCEWGYDAGHPFVRRGEALSEAGIPHWMCPGTSSWLSLGGRATNAVDNCREAASASLATGAAGFLVTDWGDFGHLQPLAVSDIGLAAGAAFSWNVSSAKEIDASAAGELVALHAFGDPTGLSGTALVELGDVARLLPMQAPNLSALVLHLYLPQLPVGSGFTTGIEPRHLDGIDDILARCLNNLALSRPSTPHGLLARDELAATCRLVQLASHDARLRLAAGGPLAAVSSADRRTLAVQLEPLIAEHRARWLARDRPGGLDESCAWLEHLLQCYRDGETAGTWAGPLVERARAAEAADR